MHATPIKYFRLFAFIRSLFMVDKRPVFFFIWKMIVWVGVVYSICSQHAALIRRLYYIFRCFHFLINYVIILYRLQARHVNALSTIAHGYDWTTSEKDFVAIAAKDDELSSTLSLVCLNGMSWFAERRYTFVVASSLNVKSRRSFVAGFALQHPMHGRRNHSHFGLWEFLK